MLWVAVVVGAVLLVAVVMIVIGLRDAGDVDPLQDRLAEYAARGEIADLEEIELSQPIAERIIYPIARKLGELALRFTPQNAIQQTTKKLERAGSPGGMDATVFWALRIAGLSLGALLFFVATIAPEGSFLKGRGLLIGIPAAAMGFFLPELWLQGRISKRQTDVRKALPDALDLLTICVEAGLGFDAAMSKVYEKWDNVVAISFGRVIREIQLGKLRRDALKDMAERLSVSEMTSFIAAVIQSEQLGVSLARVLRIQADQMRIKRRQIAQEAAAKAPIKMLIPMALLIFPSICIVLMTPAVLMLMQSALGGILGF
ncbi:MAG: type II secretion system F family protein [Anaerolineales bacterium]